MKNLIFLALTLTIGCSGSVVTVTGTGPNCNGITNGYVYTAQSNQCVWSASGGGGVNTVGTFSGSSQTNGASISGSTITFGPADATNPGMVSTGTQTLAGAKTFSTTPINITETSNLATIKSSTDIKLNFKSDNAIPRLQMQVGSGSTESLSFFQQNGNMTVGAGPFISDYPSLGFNNGSSAAQGNLLADGNLSSVNSLSSQTWLGGRYASGAKVDPWYAMAADRIAMAYTYLESQPSVSKGEIKVKTGTPLTLNADSVRYGNYNMQPSEYDAGNSSTAITVNWTNGSAQKVTMTGNCTFTLSNPQTGGSYVLKLVQDGTGSRTYTWPASVLWSGGVAPTGSGANKIDVITLYWDGTNYFGQSALNY